MKFICNFSLLLVLICIGCTSAKNSPEFIENTSGTYLYNSDETVIVYYEEDQLHMSWRGAESIKPMRLNDSTFFVKEMNKKIQFLTNPADGETYIGVVPKEKGEEITYDYPKLAAGENIPSQYLENKQFDKALQGYLAIKAKDSTDPALSQRHLNSLGYDKLYDQKDPNSAIEIFKINVALHPDSYNVYDSLAEAYLKSGDTVQAIENYKKSLVLDSGNERLKRTIKKLEKTE